jgi:hypothetical protein
MPEADRPADNEHVCTRHAAIAGLELRGGSRQTQCWRLDAIANIIQTIPIIIAPQTSAPKIARIGSPKMTAAATNKAAATQPNR